VFSPLRGVQIKVKVYVPAFIDHRQLDVNNSISLDEGATMADLYRKLKIPLPLRLSFLYVVNYEQVKWNTRLKDGDTVTFLFPIHGG
jgi:molybdopterin converting factor small subunit